MGNEFNDSVLNGLGILFGAGIPVVIIMFVKDWISNFVAGLQIRLYSNYQYINSFEWEGRKHCRISNIHFTTVEVQDTENDQFITIMNRDFLKTRIWRNVDRTKIEKD